MLLADTGPLVAGANSRDRHHQVCADRRHFTVVRPAHIDAFALLPVLP